MAKLTEKLNDCLEDKSCAAFVMRQPLKAVEGDNAVIYPSTFSGIGYNIDIVENSNSLKNVCLIDSVGSQANRMEPIFKDKPYSKLIPHIEIEIREPAKKGKEPGRLIETISLLDVGHRIADAIVRFSDGSEQISEVFKTMKSNNSAEAMAKLAPTSLVFGVWDSRDTGVKIKRIIRSVIRACNFHELERSAQYTASTKHYVDAGIDKALLEKKVGGKTLGSTHGFYDNPSTGNPGGIMLDADSILIREAVLSLSALRQLRVGDDHEATLKLRRYILGLSLVAFTAPQDCLLRMGCELTGNPKKPVKWEIVHCDGSRPPLDITPKDAFDFAKAAADKFVVGEHNTFIFDPKKAKAALSKKDQNTEGE